MIGKKFLVLFGFLVSFSVMAKTWNVQITGMTCGGCAKSITAELKKSSAVKNVEISVDKGQGVIETEDVATFGEEQIRQAISKAGYKATTISSAK